MAGETMAGWPIAPWLDWMAGNRSTAPLGGDVTQRFAFAPLVTVTGEGNPALEREIVESVATYGAQIGQLSEIVLALAEGRETTGMEAVAKLRDMAEAIERKKAEFGKTALDRARKALDELRLYDKAGYALLLASLNAKP